MGKKQSWGDQRDAIRIGNRKWIFIQPEKWLDYWWYEENDGKKWRAANLGI